MRSKKPLISLLRKLVDAVEEEASRNPAFANKLEELLLPFQETQEMRPKPSGKRIDDTLPDVHGELTSRGDRGFRIWLREQSVEVLRAIIRREDLDTARRASKWKDEGKLADFIADGLRARMSRGSAFIERERINRATHASAEESKGTRTDEAPPRHSGDVEGIARTPVKDEHQPSGTVDNLPSDKNPPTIDPPSN